MYLEVTEDNLQEIVTDNDKVVVQYSAGWCGNCRIMKPKFKKLSREMDGVQFVMIDAEKNPNSRQLATVDNLPTFAVFQGGSLLNQTQTNKFDVLKELVDEVADH